MYQIIIKQDSEYKFTSYPRASLDEKVEGLDKSIQYYVYQKIDQPQYDGRLYTVKTEMEFTDEKYNDFIMICKDKHTIEQLPNGTIIQNLNDDLGSYLDSNYPIWKRIKHINNIINGVDIEVSKTMMQWLDDCRLERDNQEMLLLEKNILPTFTYIKLPEL